ncbi:MAG: hypothetical protein RL454_122 [Actinomycetota bacterium]
MTEQPMTRRQARELERQRAQAAINGQSDLSEPDFTPTTGQLSVIEPKSLVVTEPTPDLANLSVVLKESGATLTTGSIELPWLKEVEVDDTAVIEAAAVADVAHDAEITESVISGIDPIPARIHERSRRRKSVFPTRLRKGWGVVHLVLVSAFVLFALFVALVASILLGIIKF